MKQKKIYFVLLFFILVLNMVYMIDRNQIAKTIESYKKDIRIIDAELKTGSNIMEEVNILRKNFVDNIDQLKDYKISASVLMNELSNLKTLARQSGIIIKDLEIDPRNTFPNPHKKLVEDHLKLDRQTLNLNLSGDFLDIGNFIELVQKNETPFVLNHCLISLDSLDPKGVIAQLEYLTYVGEGP